MIEACEEEFWNNFYSIFSSAAFNQRRLVVLARMTDSVARAISDGKRSQSRASVLACSVLISTVFEEHAFAPRRRGQASCSPAKSEPISPTRFYGLTGMVATNPPNRIGILRTCTFRAMGVDSNGNNIAFGTPIIDYRLTQGEYWAARTTQSARSRIGLLTLQQLPQHILQNSAILVVQHFLRSVDPDRRV